MNDIEYMKKALKLAEKARDIGEVPVGAIIVYDNKIISKAYNSREIKKNALYHAEILAIDKACKKLGGWRLHKCEIYTTLEPCPMCAGAIINSRIKRVVYGTADKKSGAFGSIIDFNSYPFNHKPEIISGVCEEECAEILKVFFKDLRQQIKTHLP